MNTISTEKLQEKLNNSNITLIEVLEKEKYEREHIKGAIHIPLTKIATVAKNKFDKDLELVVYCSDKDCTASPVAAKKLKKEGFNNVYHYKGGKKAWKEAGLPMES